MADCPKKNFSVIVNDKEQIIGGRTEDEAIFQPIKHLSGEFCQKENLIK